MGSVQKAQLRYRNWGGGGGEGPFRSIGKSKIVKWTSTFMDINGLFLNFRFCLSHDEENEFTALGYFQKLLLLLWGGGGPTPQKAPHI